MTTPQQNPIDRRSFLAAATAVSLAGPALAASTRRGPALPWSAIRDGSAFTLDGTAVPGGNTLVFKGDAGSILIDAKFTWLGSILRDDARDVSGGASARLVLINTHHHADHTAGNWAFTGRHAVYAHTAAARRISNQHDQYLADARAAARSAEGSGLGEPAMQSAGRALEEAINLPIERWAPTRLIDAPRTPIPFAGNELHLHHFGVGHTDNDLVVHHPGLNVIHTGDLVFQGYHPFCDQSASVSLRGWIASLWRIVELCDRDTIVVPGHGVTSDRSIVHDQIRYIEQLLDSVRAEIENGKSKQEIMEITFPFMKGLNFEQIRPRAIAAAYDEIVEN